MVSHAKFERMIEQMADVAIDHLGGVFPDTARRVAASLTLLTGDNWSGDIEGNPARALCIIEMKTGHIFRVSLNGEERQRTLL